MNPPLTRTLASLTLAVMALLATTTSAWAAGVADPARLRLTPALLDRMEAAAAELRKIPQPPDKQGNEDEVDAESGDDIARNLDAHPQISAPLAGHGPNSRAGCATRRHGARRGESARRQTGARPDARAARQCRGNAHTPEERRQVKARRHVSSPRPRPLSHLGRGAHRLHSPVFAHVSFQTTTLKRSFSHAPDTQEPPPRRRGVARASRIPPTARRRRPRARVPPRPMAGRVLSEHHAIRSTRAAALREKPHRPLLGRTRRQPQPCPSAGGRLLCPLDSHAAIQRRHRPLHYLHR